MAGLAAGPSGPDPIDTPEKKAMTNPLRPGPVDVHAHIVPPRLIDRLAAGERAGYSAERLPDGRVKVTLAGKPFNPPLLPGMVDLALRLAAMDGQGVAAQVVSPWVGLTGAGLPADDAAWLGEAVNAEIGAFIRAHPERFLGLGTAPLALPDAGVAILERAVGEHGLLGVEIPTIGDVALDDRALDPFWAAAERLGALVMLHPLLAPMEGPYGRYFLNNLIHNPLETSVAAAHLVFGGVMERFPDLRILLVHGGGFLPYNLGRLVRGRAARPETAVAMTGSVEASVARFLFDTVTHSPAALRFLVEEMGADRVLLGTDYPFDMADPDPCGTVAAAGLAAAARVAIERGNLDGLLEGAPVRP